MAQSMDVTSDDKLWAALGYPIAIVALVVLFMEDKKSRPFIKFHAVQSLILWALLIVLYGVLSVVTLGFGSLCFWVIFAVVLWPAYDAYRGNYTKLPVISDFIRKQGWA